MPFRRKTRNRRHARNYVLDVKLSASQRRQSRLRRITLFLTSSAVLLVTFLIAWRGSEVLLRKAVYENRAFAIHRLEIETDGVLSIEQLRTWAGVKANENLLALDLARVERDLKLVPAIDNVVVERVLPKTLRIRVTEREPIAQVRFFQSQADGAYEAGIYTLDVNGFFMFQISPSQRAQPIQPTEELPVITGIPALDIRPGRQVESAQARSALNLIDAFSRSPMAGLVDIKQVNVATPGVLVLTTGQGNELTFSLLDFDGQLRRWRVVHDYAQRAGKYINLLDLAVANNAPMLWSDAASVAPPPPKPTKANRYKKKHV